VRFVILVLGCCLLVAGCGGDDPPKLPTEHVRLSVTAPADRASVRRGTIDVQGRVSPKRSEVAVLGRPALVTDGRFTVVVPLEPGMNVIDVSATAPRRLPALTAVRVIRDVLVTVPELAGLVEDELDARLEPLGLRADVTRGGGLFDVLRGGEPRVCEQDPQPGARVRRGRVVDVIVAKKC
jgi:hypothetical protein